MKKTPFYKRLLAGLLRDERGLTLVELIASSLIFFTILIPLVSVYVKGVEIYQETTVKNQLRSDTDFLIGNVMRTIQEASYVKLAPETATERQDPANEQVKSIIAASFPAFQESNAASSCRIYLYKRSVKRSEEAVPDEEATSTGNRTVSLLTRETYSFAPCPQAEGSGASCEHVPFPTDPDRYLVQGYFEIDQPAGDSSGKKRVTLYLVVAQRYDTMTLPFSQEDRRDHELFADWDAVASAVAQNSEQAQYVRVVRTEIDLSSEQKG
ncbi:PilW family protein [Brevibacillus sp. GCM10020057]|uniref:PilW family protein n=1 Tax=Brevibacillus sp. GCM10020057 TaxID=3317327 RepID=UPI00364490EA